ncbi:hypothetical protein LTR56_020932 [Elasticomyces elasticus]|nr:hypothetical protein LTR56_020932 [Elasticomyces elasticus]KAK3665216.1 hypothetical protein LTR22_004023 [Elasticomyces elasticus]KAK4909832.1 hypothetical protein LTR49_021430 [Elasticomyces elasticus]KAK5749723.1 hypothetical protein LTS12_020221 [Elasticomyces elasticus]
MSHITIPRATLETLNLRETDPDPNKLILQINSDKIIQSQITLETIQHAIIWGNKLDAATQAKWNANPWLGSRVSTFMNVYQASAWYTSYTNGDIWNAGNDDALQIQGTFLVYGDIRGHFRLLGAAKSAVGFPLSDELACPDNRGRFNRFSKGTIYWTPTTGAHEVYGDILAAWTTAGTERSWLGYPLTGGRMNSFENGQVTWRAQDRHVESISFKDKILQKYRNVGGIFSKLGLPTSTDMPAFRAGNVITTSFRGGSITVPLDQPAASSLTTKRIQVWWRGLECQVRQESEDELAGAVSVYAPGTQGNQVIKFPSGSEPWKLGHDHQRIMGTSSLLYDGPPADIIITTQLVELDQNAGDPLKIADVVFNTLKDVGKIAEKIGVATGNEVVDAIAREIQIPADVWSEAQSSEWWKLIMFMRTLLDSEDDKFNAGVLEIKADKISQRPASRQVLHRTDDPTPVVWTDRVVVTGVDNGNDLGLYAFYFEVNVINETASL